MRYVVPIQCLFELPRPIRIALAVAPLLLLLVVIYPFQTVVVPTWSLRVIDNSKDSVAGINVTEHWQNYLLEDAGHEDVKITSDSGVVTFPERTIRASLLRRGFARVTKTARSGIQKRTDCYASVVVWGSKEHETTVAVHSNTPAPQETIVVHRLNYNSSWRLKENKNRLSEFGMSSN